KAVKEQLRAVPAKGVGYAVLRYLAPEEIRAQLADLAAARITFNYLGQFDRILRRDSGLRPVSERGGQDRDPDSPLGNWLTIDAEGRDGRLRGRFPTSREMYEPQTLRKLAEQYRSELEHLIAHCCDAASGGLTPSDVPLAGLNQDELDALPLVAREVTD